MNRVPTQQISLHMASSNLALSTTRDEAATAFVGCLCQCLTTLSGNNFLLKIDLLFDFLIKIFYQRPVFKEVLSLENPHFNKHFTHRHTHTHTKTRCLSGTRTPWQMACVLRPWEEQPGSHFISKCLPNLVDRRFVLLQLRKPVN